MKLILEQWNQYVESVEHDKGTAILYEELLNIQEGTYGDLLQLLESNQYLLEESVLDFLRTNAKKAISTAALLAVLFSSGSVHARDYSKAEKGVARSVQTLLADGGDYDAMGNAKVADIVGQHSRAATSEEDETARYMIVNSEAFKNKSLEKEDLPKILKALTGLIVISRDPDLPEKGEKTEKGKSKIEKHEGSFSDYSTLIISLGMNINHAELGDPDDPKVQANLAKEISKFNEVIDGIQKAGFLDDAQAAELKKLATEHAKGFSVKIETLVRQIEASKK